MIPNVTHIFQTGWNHQLAQIYLFEKDSLHRQPLPNLAWWFLRETEL